MPNQLTALCAVTSFLWLAHNLEDHQVIEHPRLSSLLVLLIAALSCYAVSFFAAWLPGTNGRFDDELAPIKAKRTNLPKKPRRYFLPGLVICVLLRLELFHRVTLDLQCSAPGIEAFLPLLILFYELLPGRRTRLGGGDDDEDHDDPGMTIFEAMGSWLSESRASLVMALVMLSVGTYLASSQDLRSTFFCSSRDWRYLVMLFQWLGLLLDAAIAIALWRILAWARTTRSRLRTLSGILLTVSLGTGLLYWASRVYVPAAPVSYPFRGLGSLYAFDVLFDGLVFSVFIIATSLLATEGSPLTLASILTFLLGLVQAARRTALTGTWENISPATVYVALTLICVGFSSFLYANNVVSVLFIHRAFIVFLLVVVTIVATIYTPTRALRVVDEHPLVRIIYDARTEGDRWLLRAAASDSLRVAAAEYRERHNGRDPPPKFDVWYNYAKEKRSVVVDHFPQIESDLLPFWGMRPSKLRESVRRVADEPSMALLQIRAGKPQHNLPPGSPYMSVMDDLVALVEGFAEHLPDVELAVNLDERPRVLAPLDQVQRSISIANRKRVGKLLPRASDSVGEDEEEKNEEAVLVGRGAGDAPQGFTSVTALREMTALTCPPGSKARAGAHWDVRDFCAACARPHSQGQYLVDWPLSQDVCHQPDLFRLHSFHMTPPELRPLQELVPVFSRAKTASYSDILLPLRRITEPPPPPTDDYFVAKSTTLFWRGKVDRPSTSYEQVRGGHQERLVHMLNRPARSEQTRLLLPRHGHFAFEQVATGAITELLPIDVAFSSYVPCKAGEHQCAAAAVASAPDEDGLRQASASDDGADEPLRHQYVVVMDTDHGPPRELVRTLRSGSVPLYASLFREWFSDRLAPWIHFVPLDLRFHALHGTLAYFAGVQAQGGIRLNGREVVMSPRDNDAQWIAEQGQRWADKALRRDDMQVYLFRLLLEWARVVDDRRDELGYVS